MSAFFNLEHGMGHQIDDPTLDRVAQLAQLSVPGQDREVVKTALNDVLTLVNGLQSVDTSGVEPMAHPLSIQQPLRSDQVTESDHSGAIPHFAPSHADHYFLVPRVIE
jgi:aspartyl-tRNA(Asn)/glutamyl-tRNA(Gln) amidotransferase subunit C